MGAAVGDRVAYSARFLQSISADFDTAERRGTIEFIDEHYSSPVARVRWDDFPDSTSLALTVNLARVGSVRFSDPHARKEW